MSVVTEKTNRANTNRERIHSALWHLADLDRDPDLDGPAEVDERHGGTRENFGDDDKGCEDLLPRLGYS